ncbi:hypothetical protein [Streptomyces sp. NPDC001815]|uniref:hypothetical protein n=1 Tax=Streptomyces sp. NPDC001815 TaxID=3154526 RepID=UPI00333065CA
MDTASLSPYVQAHLKALKRNDIAAVTDDFAPALRPFLPGIVEGLPPTFVSTENLSIEADDDHAVVLNRLVGDNGVTITMRSVWREVDGRPRIIDGAPV